MFAVDKMWRNTTWYNPVGSSWCSQTIPMGSNPAPFPGFPTGVDETITSCPGQEPEGHPCLFGLSWTHNQSITKTCRFYLLVSLESIPCAPNPWPSTTLPCLAPEHFPAGFQAQVPPFTVCCSCDLSERQPCLKSLPIMTNIKSNFLNMP